MVDYRPATGSCARCSGALGLASVRVAERWYCRAACAEGHPEPGREPAVPERRLYTVPRRFFRPRKPKELRSAGRGR